MTRKVQFHVVYSSSADEEHPATELNHHGPFVNGWQSSRLCSYPQEIILQFENYIRLKRVQLLSHQYMIASKIEFHIGDVSSDENFEYEKARYTRLGYIELSNNERTDFKSRELKSIRVDADGIFLKLIIHRNYINRYNVHNQVSIVAINLLGIDIDRSLDNYEDQYDSISTKSDQLSIVDDLAFAVYQDPEIANIIRNLDKRKQSCVNDENFDEARKIKRAIEELLNIGERLARYEVEKRQAIEEEQYEVAQAKKEKIELYRAETYKQLQAHNLLDIVMESGEGTEFLKRLQESESHQQHHEDHEQESPRQPVPPNHARPRNSIKPRRSPESTVSNTQPTVSRERPISPLRLSTNSNQKSSPTSNGTERTSPEIQKPSTPYADKVIPTLRNRNRPDLAQTSSLSIEYIEHTKKNNDDFDTASTTMSTAAADDVTAELNQTEMIEANQMMIVFDKQLIGKLYHRNHTEREQALDEIYEILDKFSGTQDDARAYLRAGIFVLARMFRLDILATFSHSLKIFHLLMNDYVRRHSIQRQDIIANLERVFPVLLQRTGDSNARLRQRAQEAIIESASYPELKPLHVIPHYCVSPFNKTCAPRLALSRCELIEQLMKVLDVRKGDNGLTVDNVSKFCAQAVEHNAGEVRELAIKILIDLYKTHGSIVKRYLPSENDQTRRVKKYRDMFDAFAKLDIQPEKEKNTHKLDRIKKPMDPMSSTKNNIEKKQHTSREQGKSSDSKHSTNKSRTPTRFDRKTPTLSVADESEFTPENTCIFCGEKNDDFIRDGLEAHYWASCPMLRRCQECNQVVEIGIYVEHLLRECAKKSKYQQCPRCTEAIGADFDTHIKLKECAEAKLNTTRCPLCHMNVREGEKPWREHLMGTDGCIKNPRRLPALKRNKNTHQQKPAIVPTAPLQQATIVKKQKKVTTNVK